LKTTYIGILLLFKDYGSDDDEDENRPNANKTLKGCQIIIVGFISMIFFVDPVKLSIQKNLISGIWNWEFEQTLALILSVNCNRYNYMKFLFVHSVFRQLP